MTKLLYFKDLRVFYFPKKHFVLILQVYMWFQEFPKAGGRLSEFFLMEPVPSLGSGGRPPIFNIMLKS